MAPRKRKPAEIETHNNILHVLEAIQPRRGKLDDKEAQNALLESVVKARGLDIKASDLRVRLTGAIYRHYATKDYKNQDIWTKPTNQVLAQDYLDCIGFKSGQKAACKQSTVRRVANKTEQRESLKLKLGGRPAKQKESPRQGSAQSELGQSGVPAADTETSSDVEHTEGVEGINATRAGVSGKGIKTPHESSKLPSSKGKETENNISLSSDDASSTTTVVGAASQEASRKVLNPTDVPEHGYEALQTRVASLAKNDAPTKSIHIEQSTEDVDDERQTAKQHREELAALRGQLASQKATAENEIQSLKLQLENIKSQALGKKRAFEASHPDDGGSSQSAAKRPKYSIAHLQADSRCEIQREMVEISKNVQHLADNFCYERGIQTSVRAELLVNPGPELERLYAQIHQSEGGDDWRRMYTITPRPAFAALRCLIGASIFGSVFGSEPLWSSGNGNDYTFAGLARHLFENDNYVREAAHEKLCDRDFQEGEVAQYATKLALNLSATLWPHLERLTAGKPISDCTAWIDALTDIFRATLVIKARIDIFQDGKLQPFWSGIGSRVVPAMTSIESIDKHLANEVCFVYWPGLRMKVDGMPDNILSREQAATKPIISK